jgi:hypothetical protein
LADIYEMELKMIRNRKIAWLLMAFPLLVMSACNGTSPTVAPTIDTAPIFTQVAVTAWALQTQTAQAAPTQAMPTVANTPQPTPIPQATDTLQSTPTPLPTSISTATLAVVNDPILGGTGSTVSNGPVPTMSVTLIANDLYTYSTTVSTNKVLIFRAQVENTSQIPLQVVANLSIPDGWGESEAPYSDCPDTATLGHKVTCTISWKFNPFVTGQVTLRVYVRGYYKDTAGLTQRITQSPGFIVNVVP